MRTVSLVAVLLGSSIASAQPETDEPRVDEPRADAAPPAVEQIIDTDAPPPARPLAAKPIDPRALPNISSSREPEPADDDDEYIVGGRRSGVVAFGLSGGTTLAGIVMIAMAASSFEHDNEIQAALGISGVVALALGPTAGHIYVGSPWNPGLKTRLASLGIAVGGALVAVIGCPPLGSDCNEGVAAIGGAVFLAGGVTYAGATLYEIVDAPRAASRYNDSHRASVMLVPAAGSSPGLSIAGTF